MNEDILDRLAKLAREDVEPSAHTREIAEAAIVEIERLRDLVLGYESERAEQDWR